MPLQYQPVDIPLARGVDTRSDAKVMEPTQLTTLQNAVFDKRGALIKVEGFTALTADVFNSGTNISAGRGLFKHQRSLLMSDKSKLYQFSVAEQSWVPKGTYLGWHTTERTVVSNTSGQVSDIEADGTETFASSAVANGVRVIGWAVKTSAQRGIWYTVEETSSGTTIVPPTRLATISSAVTSPVFVINPSGSSNVLLIFGKVDDGKIGVFKFDTTDIEGSIGGSVTYSTATPVTADTVLGLSVARSGSQVVYSLPSDTNDLRVGFIAAAGTFGNTAELRSGVVSETKPTAVFANSSGSSNVALFCISASGRLGYSMFNTSASETANGTVNDSDVTYERCTGVWASDDASWTAIWQGNTNGAGPEKYYIRTAVHDSTGTQTTAPANKLFNSYLVGAPFRFESRDYYFVTPNPAGAAATAGTAHQVDTHLLCMDLSDHKPVGCQLYAESFGPRQQLVTAQVHESAGTLWVDYSACDAYGGVKQVRYDASTADAFKQQTGANVGGNLFLGGAMAWEFADAELYENGFLVTPGMETSSDWVTQGTNGQLDVTGVYRYRIYYEYTDVRNRRTQSAFPFDFEVTLTGSNDDITLRIPTLQHTRRNAYGVRIAVYRTVGSGTTFYRVDSVINDPTAAYVTVLDTISDTALEDNELDYQSAGELDNLPFPACYGMVAGQERLYAIRSANARQVAFTKLPDNDAGLEWNDALFVEFPEDIHALGAFGSQIYAFAEHAIYFFSGEGPDNTGTAGSFSAPVKLALNIGCKNPRAVGETPLGVAFVSEQRGIWLIGTDGLKFIGDALQRGEDSLLDQNFTSVIPIPGTSRIRFTSSNTDNHAVLEWDYEFNQWSTHTNPHTDMIGAVVVDGAYYHLRASTGIVYEHESRVDDGLTFTRDGSAIVMVLKTAWIRPTGSAVANHRATHGYLLGRDRSSGHSVTVEVAYDYDETFTTIGTFAATGFPHIRFHLPRISFRAIMFRITEVADGTPGEGIELSALGLELATEGTTGGRLLDS